MHSRHHPVHTHTHEMDWLQLFFLWVCALDLGFFLFYMFMYELNSQSMISDTLFSTPEYAIILTVTLALRMLGAVLFLYRYRNIFPVWEYIGFVGVFITLLGWAWLVLHQDNANHFAGVAVFCLGSFMYSIAFLQLAGKTHEHLRKLHQALRWFLLLTTIILVGTFVILWAIEENDGRHGRDGGPRNAYIVEHVAYITQILFYATFILYHTPNPDKSPHVIVPNSSYHTVPDENDSSTPLVPLSHVTNLNY